MGDMGDIEHPGGHAELHLRPGGQCCFHLLVQPARCVDVLHLRHPQPAQHGGGQQPARRPEHHRLRLRHGQQPGHRHLSQQVAVHHPVRQPQPAHLAQHGDDDQLHASLQLQLPARCHGQPHRRDGADRTHAHLELRRHLPAHQRGRPGPVGRQRRGRLHARPG